MQNEACLQPYLNPRKRSIGIVKTQILRNKELLSPSHSSTNVQPIENKNNNLKLAFSKNNLSHEMSLEELQNDSSLHKAKCCISLIEDPLWKHVCFDFLNMMGPTPVLKIEGCKLGALSAQEKTIELSCQTKEAAQLLHQYNFVILEALRVYFPFIKEIQLKINLK